MLTRLTLSTLGLLTGLALVALGVAFAWLPARVRPGVWRVVFWCPWE
jgi:hypothetical protein